MTRIRPQDRKSNASSFLLPIIIAVIVIILLAKAFFGGGGDSGTSTNEGFVNISPNQEKSEIYIYMSGDSKKKIEGSTKMYATDSKMEVVSGEAKIALSSGNTKIFGRRLAEIHYGGKGPDGESIEILNGDAWFESDGSPLQISAKHFSVKSSGVGIFAVEKNLVSSTIYVLKGEVEVTAMIGSNERRLTVGVGQQLKVDNINLQDPNFKLETNFSPIDSLFRESEFFANHNGSSYLNSDSQNTASGSSGSSGTGSTSMKSTKYLIVNYPEDNTTVELSSLDVEGKVTSDAVDKVTLNDKEARINPEDRTFIYKDFELKNQTNDIVYKAYDADGGLLTKGVITIYSTSKEKESTPLEKPTVTTYPISSKDFQILEPSENPYKTSEDLVKIVGRIANKGVVKFITINDFRLTKFPQYGTSWMYFANKDNENMNDGINLYTIKYYGKDDNLLFTNLVTIVKEPTASEEPKTPSSGSGSNDAGGAQGNSNL